MSQQITGCIVQNTVLIHGGMILPLILTKSAPGETFRADSLQYFIFHVPLILSHRQVVVTTFFIKKIYRSPRNNGTYTGCFRTGFEKVFGQLTVSDET